MKNPQDNHSLEKVPNFPVKSKRHQFSKRHIPDDILCQILELLPIKSLMKFRFVSKGWNNLASKINPDNNAINCSHLLFLNLKAFSSVHDISLTRCALPYPRYNLPRLPLDRATRIVGVFEGLVCLERGSFLYIWDPLVGLLKKFRLTENAIRNDDDYRLSGFGFAHRNDDYKFVMVLRFSEVVEVYSLATDSWRTFEYSRARFIRWWFGPHVFFNGSIYWLVRLRPGSNGNFLILRFDVEEERFSEMEAPPLNETDYVEYPRLQLVAVNGFLVVLKLHFGDEKIINVWGWINKESAEYSPSRSWSSAQKIVLSDKSKLKGCVRDRESSITTEGHIVLQNEVRTRTFVYECCCDGNTLGFKLRTLGDFGYSIVTSIMMKETVSVLDQLNKNIIKSKSKSRSRGQRR